MRRKLSSRLSGGQKVIVVIILLFCVWKFVLSAAVLNALFLFLTAGVVPGTRHALSPAGTAVAVATVFVLCVALIFRKEWGRLIRWRAAARAARHLPAEAEALPVHEEEATSSAAQTWPIVITLPGKPGAVAKRWQGTKIASGRLLRHAANRGRALLTELRPWLLVLGRLAVVLAKLMWLLAGLAATGTARLLALAWHWLEPQLHRFDRWLELQVRAFLRREPLASWIKIGRKHVRRTAALWQKRGE